MGELREVGFTEGPWNRKDWVSWEHSEALLRAVLQGRGADQDHKIPSLLSPFSICQL